jgi:hypothetical protein
MRTISWSSKIRLKIGFDSENGEPLQVRWNWRSEIGYTRLYPNGWVFSIKMRILETCGMRIPEKYQKYSNYDANYDVFCKLVVY